MIGSHFFPRNCNTRRACVLRDRRSSLGIHSLAVSKENSRQLRSLQKSQTISLNQLPQKRKKASKRQSNILKRQQQHEYQKQPKLNPRKKTLYVKGFCKKPFEIKINNSDEILPRQAITSNGRRIRKDLSEKNRRLDTSIPLHPNFKEVKLIKRKSKDTCVFRGWEINYDDFTDF